MIQNKNNKKKIRGKMRANIFIKVSSVLEGTLGKIFLTMADRKVW